MEHILDLVDAVVLQRLCQNRNAVVFGTGRIAADYGEILPLIGIRSPSYLKISDEIMDKRIPTEKVMRIDETFAEREKLYILLTESRGVNAQAEYLLEKGFTYLEDFDFISGARFQTALSKASPLDPNMGHGTLANNEKGCRLLGKNLDEDIKIAVNGASLVDETCFNWKLWPELLYEKSAAQEKPVTFLLCSAYGYTTSQCLLKLIRDILPLAPDIVIDYCSLENDCLYGEWMSAPFVIGYQKKILSYVQGKIGDRFENKQVKDVNLGYTKRQRTAEVILENIRMSKALCDVKGIRYICVWPPLAFTQQSHALEDIELQWLLAKRTRSALKILEEIEAKMSDEVRECIVDARKWMDGHEGMFYDQFHMKESGNRIIAEHMMKVLGI
ncbi:MAG: hypothetical protein NC398_06270 [Acetatifactor muris]|nr:hypothetical protein [Acetatifactor muris]MCM1526646.1 hypothetical protein [Bacteroides sp.]